MNVVILYLLLFISAAASGRSSKLDKAFRKAEIVPQLLDKSPECELHIGYEDSKHVKLGNELTPNETVSEPIKLGWSDRRSNKYYLLAMMDPDVPCRQNASLRAVKHWLVGNIKGKSLDVKKGTTLAEYVGPQPPEGSGIHRYILMGFEQPGKLDFSDEGLVIVGPGEKRLSWNLREFIKKYKLRGPAAANFYYSKNEAD